MGANRVIPIIENILSTLIHNKLTELRSNTTLISKILRMAPQDISNLITFISDNKIPVKIGFPRNPLDIPCFCIFLGNEDEMEESLGDYGGLDNYEVDSHTETLPVLYNPRICPYPYIQTTHKPLEDVTQILPYVDYEIQNHEKGIVGITCNDFFLNGNFTVTECETVLDVSYTYYCTAYEMFTTSFSSRYRVEAISNNADLTVQLYHLLKWMFMSGRLFLYSQGLTKQVLGGMDLEHLPKYFPEFVYRRALTLSCINSQSITENTVQFVEEFIEEGGL